MPESSLVSCFIDVSSALQSGAGVLYSEDMQDGLMIEERLEVRNPFAVAR